MALGSSGSSAVVTPAEKKLSQQQGQSNQFYDILNNPGILGGSKSTEYVPGTYTISNGEKRGTDAKVTFSNPASPNQPSTISSNRDNSDPYTTGKNNLPGIEQAKSNTFYDILAQNTTKENLKPVATPQTPTTPTTPTTTPTTPPATPTTQPAATQQAVDTEQSSYSVESAPAAVPSATVGRLNKDAYFDTGREYLDAQRALAEEQLRRQNQYAIEQGINELQRAQEDAQQQFQTQRNQVSRDEQIALDNQALYSEARGDKGGIGAAQYAAIQAQAAQNRLAVNQQQTKLATDTARQIVDLRAQGEFKTADELLSLTQTYLGQLQQLYVNAEAYSLDVDRFNIQLAQWDNEFAAQVAQLTGTYNGAPTLASQSNVASMAMTMLQSGMDIGPQQIAALKQIYGLDDARIADIKMKAQLSARGSVGGGSDVTEPEAGSGLAPSGVDALYLDALTTTDPAQYVKENWKSYGLTKQPSDNAYKDWMENDNNVWYYDSKGVSDTAKHERDKLLRGSTLAGSLNETKLDYIYNLFDTGKIDMNERNWLLSETGLVGGM